MARKAAVADVQERGQEIPAGSMPPAPDGSADRVTSDPSPSSEGAQSEAPCVDCGWRESECSCPGGPTLAFDAPRKAIVNGYDANGEATATEVPLDQPELLEMIETTGGGSEGTAEREERVRVFLQSLVMPGDDDLPDEIDDEQSPLEASLGIALAEDGE